MVLGQTFILFYLFSLMLNLSVFIAIQSFISGTFKICILCYCLLALGRYSFWILGQTLHLFYLFSLMLTNKVVVFNSISSCCMSDTFIRRVFKLLFFALLLYLFEQFACFICIKNVCLYFRTADGLRKEQRSKGFS